MDLRLTPTLSPTPTARAAAAPAAALRANNVQGEFGSALKSALGAVSAAQNEAERMQRQVTLDNPAVSLEETMVAIQKAQVSFQAVLHVRNRMVQAYTDIMNMQV